MIATGTRIARRTRRENRAIMPEPGGKKFGIVSLP